MRKNQTSMTAIGIAILRGIESEKPAGERLCYDPYARRFVNAALYNLIRFFDKIGYSERKGPGVTGFLAVRERHIDEFLRATWPRASSRSLSWARGWMRVPIVSRISNPSRSLRWIIPLRRPARSRRSASFWGASRPRHLCGG